MVGLNFGSNNNRLHGNFGSKCRFYSNFGSKRKLYSNFGSNTQACSVAEAKLKVWSMCFILVVLDLEKNPVVV